MYHVIFLFLFTDRRTIHFLFFNYLRLWHQAHSLFKSKSCSIFNDYNLSYLWPSVLWLPQCQCLSPHHLSHTQTLWSYANHCIIEYDPFLNPLIKYVFWSQYSPSSFCLFSSTGTILQLCSNSLVHWHLISHSLLLHHFNDPYASALNSLDSKCSLLLSGGAPTVEWLSCPFLVFLC